MVDNITSIADTVLAIERRKVELIEAGKQSHGAHVTADNLPFGGVNHKSSTPGLWDAPSMPMLEVIKLSIQRMNAERARKLDEYEQRILCRAEPLGVFAPIRKLSIPELEEIYAHQQVDDYEHEEAAHEYLITEQLAVKLCALVRMANELRALRLGLEKTYAHSDLPDELFHDCSLADFRRWAPKLLAAISREVEKL